MFPVKLTIIDHMCLYLEVFRTAFTDFKIDCVDLTFIFDAVPVQS